ncbi:prepilin-type N-terminal cleavage/methylation domain-containing protein [Halomonas sp. CKK8]|uniref:PilW family protein n=1 Tax=Halomonas sp. CKK8 TaxID=3036127 RepID=UPI0024150FC1|nr:prepilin-type N-terminal cleavage/methylation domain-containing protein [Halomonas sp. CKK8]WFM70965.1 prepilin-type N-terminal cleavage/methylation domain-containing protein [Halomonas sp. CKK8]
MKSNGGFSLVELMVAMVIGLIIILGAGQLFLTAFQTNRQVETLSEKQAAVNFAVEVLMRDIRRADWSSVAPESSVSSPVDTLTLTVPNRGDTASCSTGSDVDKVYSVGSKTVDGEPHYYLQLDQACSGDDLPGAQELVGGLSPDGFEVTPEGDYGMLVTLKLVSTDSSGAAEGLTFFAVNRTAAVTN